MSRMDIEQLRIDAAELIRATHRRLGDSSGPARVTITESSRTSPDTMRTAVRAEYGGRRSGTREFNHPASLSDPGDGPITHLG